MLLRCPLCISNLSKRRCSALKCLPAVFACPAKHPSACQHIARGSKQCKHGKGKHFSQCESCKASKAMHHATHHITTPPTTRHTTSLLEPQWGKLQQAWQGGASHAMRIMQRSRAMQSKENQATQVQQVQQAKQASAACCSPA